MDRMALNAAMKQIAAAGWDQASAQVIVDHCHELPLHGHMTMEVHSVTTNDSQKTEGFVPGHGNAEYSDGPRTERKEKYWGGGKERIGHYRVWREEDSVWFHHYWASDITTSAAESPEDNPPEYVVGFDPATRNASWLAVNEVRVIFQLGPVCFGKASLRVLHGRRPVQHRVNGLFRLFGGGRG